MRHLILAASVAISCTVLAAGSASATMINNLTCVTMAEQVKAALAANAQSPNYQEAAKEQGFGRDYCANSLYQTGVNHYSRALTLLGVSKN